ncbi:predicted protein [Nematostella vectensis]|uniref:Histamine N-methyltransferase n=1 Tax=Nematostella vectensis TaxID=45351 RepID=A7SBQ3_NEMVE|nr:histamine N-methyltransferase B [Nematostella vectensis]EDO38881.1 predicted protein [Nematostella vectensis]|eukprot:XP_001630944.1 predicted protein [Nematostella vectensis]
MSVLPILDHYNHSYFVFWKCSNIDQSTAACLKEVIPNILSKKELVISVENPIRILSVGSGRGELDMVILRSILAGYKAGRALIHQTVVEPSNSSLVDFKKAAASDDIPEVVFSFHPTTFQEFSNGNQRERKYFMIHFLHSIYYMDIKTALAWSYDNLQNGGIIVCLVRTAQQPIYQTLKMLASLKGKAFCHICSEDVTDVIKENGWEFEKHAVKFYLDLKDILDAESTEGNLLLDFLTLTPYFRKTEPIEIAQQIEELIKELSYIQDGKMVAKFDSELIVIHK